MEDGDPLNIHDCVKHLSTVVPPKKKPTNEVLNGLARSEEQNAELALAIAKEQELAEAKEKKQAKKQAKKKRKVEKQLGSVLSSGGGPLEGGGGLPEGGGLVRQASELSDFTVSQV